MKQLTERQKELLLPKWKRRRLKKRKQKLDELKQGFTNSQLNSWLRDFNLRF